MDDYIAKPVKMQDLSRVLERAPDDAESPGEVALAAR